MDKGKNLKGSSNASTTVVLAGTTGKGKSATGNSILGRKAFESKASSKGITRQCKMQSTILRDDRILNVIDTPGLFDYSAGSHFAGEEIVKCMQFAKDGIHAVIVVLSVGSRFSREEEVSLKSLEVFFGNGILDHMIVVFTGGDDLEDNDETLGDYLGRDCPKPLQRILEYCKHRMVLFNNHTEDESKRLEQVNTLLSYVDEVIASNGGKPYSIKAELMMLPDREREVNKLKGNSEYSEEEHQLRRLTEKMERKMKTHLEELEKQLAEERAERDKAEKIAREQLAEALAALSESKKRAQDAETKLHDVSRLSDDINQLRENLEKAQKEKEEFRKYKTSLTPFLDSLGLILGVVARIGLVASGIQPPF